MNPRLKDAAIRIFLERSIWSFEICMIGYSANAKSRKAEYAELGISNSRIPNQGFSHPTR